MLKLALDTCVIFNMINVLKLRKEYKNDMRELRTTINSRESKAFDALVEVAKRYPGYQWDPNKKKRDNIFKCKDAIHSERNKTFQILANSLFKIMGLDEEEVCSSAKKRSKKNLTTLYAIDDIIDEMGANCDIDVLIEKIIDALTDPNNNSMRLDILKEVEKSEGVALDKDNLKKMAVFNPVNADQQKTDLRETLEEYFEKAPKQDEFLDAFSYHNERSQDASALKLLEFQMRGEVEFFVLMENFRELNNHIEDQTKDRRTKFTVIAKEDRDLIFKNAKLVKFDSELEDVITALSSAYRKEMDAPTHPMFNDLNSLGEYGDSISMAQAVVAGLVFVTFNGKDFIYFNHQELIRNHVGYVKTLTPYKHIAANVLPYTPNEILKFVSGYGRDRIQNDLADGIEIHQVGDEPGDIPEEFGLDKIKAKPKPGLHIVYDEESDSLTIDQQ